MDTVTYIYGLVDPRSSKVFYIGRTTLRLSQRFQCHLRDGKKQRTLKGQKIFEILAAGLRPSIILIADLGVVNAEDAHLVEQAWIDFYAINHDLTNTGSSKRGGHGKNAKIVWTTKIVNLLGKESDCFIAKQLGCDTGTVKYQRQKRGIISNNKYIIKRNKNTDECKKSLDTAWTPKLIDVLGKESDTSIAIQIGCSRKVVEYQRKKQGIPRCPQTNFVIPPMGGWNRIELPTHIIEKLGTLPDRQLAEIAGVSKPVIARVRRKMLIPSYAETTGNSGQFKKGNPHPRWSKTKG